MRQFRRLVVLKRELCTRAKLSVFKSVFVPILIYDYECWVMSERVRFRIQAAKMVFLRKVRGLFLLDIVKSIDICQFLNIEPLLFRIERSQLRWYGHVTRMSHKQTAYHMASNIVLQIGRSWGSASLTCSSAKNCEKFDFLCTESVLMHKLGPQKCFLAKKMLFHVQIIYFKLQCTKFTRKIVFYLIKLIILMHKTYKLILDTKKIFKYITKLMCSVRLYL